MDTLVVVALWGLGVWGLYHLFMGRAKSRLARDRMLAVEAGEEERAGEERPEPWLEGWLTRAGIRAPGGGAGGGPARRARPRPSPWRRGCASCWASASP
jgi:hypothetical protein